MTNHQVSFSSQVVALPVSWEAFRHHQGALFEVIYLTLNQGETMPLHGNDVPVLFGVLEGHGVLTVDEAVYQMSSGDWVEVKPLVSRGWKNSGSGKLKLLVVKFMS